MLGISQGDKDSCLPSQQASIRLLGCRWEWCRLTFLDRAELVDHVIREHVRTAVPIRRRDITTVQRIEEGEPSKGDSQLLQQFALTPSFASLASPVQTPISGAILHSPSFNSLVSRSTANSKLAVNFKDKTSAHVSNQSQSVSSSFASQASVVMKLTQSPSMEQVDSDSGASRADSETSGTSSSNTSTAGSDSDTGLSKSQRGYLLHCHGTKKSVWHAASHHPDIATRTSMSPRPVEPPSPSKPARDQKIYAAEGAEQKSRFSSCTSHPPINLEIPHASRKVRTPFKKKRVFRSGTLQIATTPLDLEPFPGEHSQVDALSQAIGDHSPETHDSFDYDMHSQLFEKNSYPPLQTQAPYDSQIVSQF